jgi:aryl-alcohol dehydrogenase-like predicted oxidoreductase
VIATKFGIIGTEIVNDHLQHILNSTPESIKEQVEGSLKRSRVDCIDFYYEHRIDPNVEPEVVEETIKELIAEGKIKAWGLSNAPIDYMKRAHTVCPIAAIENQYSMMWREPEEELGFLLLLTVHSEIALVKKGPLKKTILFCANNRIVKMFTPSFTILSKKVFYYLLLRKKQPCSYLAVELVRFL